MLGSVMRHARRHAVAYLALVFALSGTSYAATSTLLPNNSVGTKQVIDHSLLKRDFKRGQLPRGPQGPPGDPGDPGDQGPPGIATVGQATGPNGAMCPAGGGACQVASSTASCPSGSVVVGGGYTSSSIDLALPFAARTSGTTYGVIGINYTAGSETITAQAICAVGPGASTSRTGQSAFERALSTAKRQTAR